MPTYILRRSPGRAEYLLWSTVVDAPVSEVMTRFEAMQCAADIPGVDRDLAWEQAERRIMRTDVQGSSERTPHYGYRADHFWWRENAPEEFGEPYEVEDDPGEFVGRVGTRDALFDLLLRSRHGGGQP